LLSIVLLLINSILKITRVTRVARVTKVTRVAKYIDSAAVRLNNYKVIAELTISTIDILLLVSTASIAY